MHCKVFDEVFKKGCENLNKWTRKPKVKNFVHLILKTRDYEDSAGMFRFLVSIHKKKGRGFEKITEKFGPIWRICQLKPLWDLRVVEDSSRSWCNQLLELPRNAETERNSQFKEPSSPICYSNCK